MNRLAALAGAIGSILLYRHYHATRRKKRTQGKIRVGVVGCGKMGSAAANRLASFGVFETYAWNRTFAKTRTLDVHVIGVKDLSDMIRQVDVVVLFLSSMDAAKRLFESQDKDFLSKKYVLSLISSNPDEAKEFHALLTNTYGVEQYVDAAYAGAPSTITDGSGLLMGSTTSRQISEDIRRVAETIAGKVCWIDGNVGCAKALDYAIVDMYFANMVFYLNGLGMINAENVDADAFLDLCAYKLRTFADLFRAQQNRIDRRDYVTTKTATIKTWLAFFEGRQEWLTSRDVNKRLSRFAIDLLHDAAAVHAAPDDKEDARDEDVYRLQEILRFNRAL